MPCQRGFRALAHTCVAPFPYVSLRIITPNEEKAEPWLGARVPAVWEWTSCVVVGENGKYTKVEPGQF
jgi:hypothetical protein